MTFHSFVLGFCYSSSKPQATASFRAFYQLEVDGQNGPEKGLISPPLSILMEKGLKEYRPLNELNVDTGETSDQGDTLDEPRFQRQ